MRTEARAQHDTMGDRNEDSEGMDRIQKLLDDQTIDQQTLLSRIYQELGCTADKIGSAYIPKDINQRLVNIGFYTYLSKQ